jgi:hypothetical protein
MKLLRRLFQRRDDAAAPADVATPEPPTEPEPQRDWPDPQHRAETAAMQREVLQGREKRADEEPRDKP